MRRPAVGQACSGSAAHQPQRAVGRIERRLGQFARLERTLGQHRVERFAVLAQRGEARVDRGQAFDQQFAQRSELLKAHTALLSLRRFVEAHPIAATPRISADIDPLLADTHAFEELRLLSQLHSRSTTLTDDEIASLRRIIGGVGTDPASRLGLTPDAPYDGPRAAFAAAHPEFTPIRADAAHPALNPELVDAAGYLRTEPDRHGLELFFGAVFGRARQL